MLYPEGSIERTRRVTQLIVAALLIAGLYALDSASPEYTKEKWGVGLALLYVAAMSDQNIRGLLAIICALLLWRALA